ncbi:ninjurin-2 [Procambarus clarkii]|uniref:ninjurin-2 n=1 Tax=Procambarus clarkii TaxID=6728 RepID=UPI001E673E21|nr:ninjurin-2-like [Procambarus clarkii]
MVKTVTLFPGGAGVKVQVFLCFVVVVVAIDLAATTMVGWDAPRRTRIWLIGEKTLDANRYATKKTVAQGMLDVALLTANASQLKYVLEVGEKHPYYTVMLALIVTSLVLQVLVGVLFMIIGAMDINDPEQQTAANILNNIILIFVFVISTDNIIISSFGIDSMKINPPGAFISGNKTE